eukprot:6206930-Pleurochrysis_carterae.AAC.1
MTAHIFIAALRAQTPKALWQILIKLAPGLLASRDWTQPYLSLHAIFNQSPPPLPCWSCCCNVRQLLRSFFAGGNGLSIIRVNHLLRDNPALYIESAPTIIPVKSESPHGVFHVMRAGWRLYMRFLRVCSQQLGVECYVPNWAFTLS